MLRRRNMGSWIRGTRSSAARRESAGGLEHCRDRFHSNAIEKRGGEPCKARLPERFALQPQHPQQAQQHPPPQQPLVLGSWAAARSCGASEGRDGSIITYSCKVVDKFL